jgi:hypothetical protein
VAINNTSGLAGIAYWLNTNYDLLKTENIIRKHDDIVAYLKAFVDKQYVDGRQTVMSTKELESAVEEYLKTNKVKGLN